MSPRLRGRSLLPRVAVPAALAVVIMAVAPSLAASQGGATGGPDVLRGTAGPNSLGGGGGNDVVNGGAGNDRIVGGRGQDVLSGGRGDDRILARDGQTDLVSCGPGVDRVRADARDTIARGCERVTPAPQGELQLAVVTGNGQQALPSRVDVVVDGRPADPCVGPSGSGPSRTTTCSYRFPLGRPVTFTAAPVAPQRFQFWSTTTDQCRSLTTTCTVTTTNPAVTVLASFEFPPG